MMHLCDTVLDISQAECVGFLRWLFMLCPTKSASQLHAFKSIVRCMARNETMTNYGVEFAIAKPRMEDVMLDVV
eukprot:2472795-Amphidinium_carterae.1